MFPGQRPPRFRAPARPRRALAHHLAGRCTRFRLDRPPPPPAPRRPAPNACRALRPGAPRRGREPAQVWGALCAARRFPGGGRPLAGPVAAGAGALNHKAGTCNAVPALLGLYVPSPPFGSCIDVPADASMPSGGWVPHATPARQRRRRCSQSAPGARMRLARPPTPPRREPLRAQGGPALARGPPARRFVPTCLG
ncbi:MAG: hypothetical protein J3K34DRAFT_431865 [Monoraphidium minutum]|nr:MAG: hypothetical protein J3K34DRAFT_431865 [Monoraphidium minutum]